MPAPENFGVLLLSGGAARAHTAFMLATAAAALGRRVTIFATGEGCPALLADRPDTRSPAGVASLSELRAAAAELGIRTIVCEAGLRILGLDRAPLAERVEIAGIATFLEAVRGGQIVTV